MIAARLFIMALPLVLGTMTMGASPEFQGHGGAIRAIAVSRSGDVLTGSFDTRAIIWNGETGAAKQVLRLHEGSVSAVAFLPDGRVATGGQDGRIAIWTAGARDPETVLQAHRGPVTALAVSPDGKMLASSSWDRTAILTPLNHGKAVVLHGHEDNVNGAAFLPTGGVVTAGYDGTLRFWDRRGRAEATIRVGVPLNAVAADDSGQVWAAGADGVLRVFGLEGTLRTEIGISSVPLVALAIQDRRIAAASLDGTVSLIEPSTSAVREVIQASSGPVWSLTFDTEKDAILVGGADHVVRPWDAETGAPLGSSKEAAAEDRLGDSQGAQMFRKCAACHTLGPNDGNRAGPTLHGIFGRRIASAEGFHYSDALRGMDIVWTPESVARLFEVGPSTMTPGTSMPEQKIMDATDRAALIAFLEKHTR